MSRKRVLVIVENLPLPEDRKVWREIKALKEAGFNVSAISPAPSPFSWWKIEEGIRIYYYPRLLYTKTKFSYLFEYLNAFFWTFLLFSRVFLRNGIDVLQVCNPPEIFFPLGWIIRMKRGYFIFDHHDLSPEMYEARFGRRDFFYWILRVLEFVTVRSANKIIEPNKYYKKLVERRTFSLSGKFIIIPTAPDLSELYPDEKDVSLKKGRKYMIGYLGVINPQDGVQQLIEAIEFLVKQRKFTNFILYLIGDGDAREDLEKMVEARGLKSFVHFTGWVSSYRTLRKYLSTCDICVDSMPANSYSNLSTLNKILEYMAVGKPVVCFDLKMSRELLASAGLFASSNNPVDLADKIEWLLKNARRRKGMEEEGRKRVEKEFNWERIKEVYQGVFTGA
ncbi:MAG: glycosyltransferase family 4 protein [Caldiserica bacterium]|nr:glycosyltransferase family 4 protein [Caldisericota bacterium]